MIGDIRVAVLLTACVDVADRPVPPPGLEFDDLFIRQSPKGDTPYDLFTTLTYGQLRLSGKVFGWFTGVDETGANLTKAKLASYPGGGDPGREQRVRAGIRGAIKNGLNLDGYEVFVVISNANVDSFGGQGTIPDLKRSVGFAYLDSAGWYTRNGGHEFGHALGLSHSFGPYGGTDNSASGEYGDPFDLMSANNCFSYDGTNGQTGAGLSVPNLLLQKWLPHDGIAYLADNDAIDDTVFTITALGRPNGAHPIAVGIQGASWPAPGSHLHTVEFRRADGFDKGFPRDVVLVHRLESTGNNSYLVSVEAGDASATQLDVDAAKTTGLTPLSGSWAAPDGLEVTVDSFDLAANTATVRIGTTNRHHLVATSSQRVVRRLEDNAHGVFHFAGGPILNGPGEACAARDYTFQTFTVLQEVDVSIQRVGIEADRLLQWTLNDVPIPAGSGAVAIPLPAPGTSATLDCTLTGDSLTVANRPADGAFRIWIDVYPVASENRAEGTASLIYDFAPNLQNFEPDYYPNMAACTAAERAHVAATVGNMHTTPQAVPPGGDPESQLLRGVELRATTLPGMTAAHKVALGQARAATSAQ